jgi:hypothetical protein
MFETLDQLNWQELRVAEYNEVKYIPDAYRFSGRLLKILRLWQAE